MKRFTIILSACVLCLLTVTPGFAASDMAKLNGRLNDAATVIKQIMATPDKSIPGSILSSATCVAVIPSYKKGAFIVGAQYGQGVVTCRTRRGWSAPTFVQLAGGSFGFQIGGQATDLVLIAVNNKGMQDLLRSKVKLGGNASVAAGPVGRTGTAATSLNLKAELLSYSRSQGIFAGIDLSGSTFTQNTDDTRTFYGSNIPFSTILGGDTPTPASAQPFVRTVARYFVRARADN
ncbi:MAG TPA: lipid-binding SYLF domain-containing protein [Acidobacteriaceae bacterium]|nr:lipid-binding SYLF domain-containing protein [Acidobacteriaceae bacterium]